MVTLLSNDFTTLTINLFNREEYPLSGRALIVVVFDNKMALQVVSLLYEDHADAKNTPMDLAKNLGPRIYS